MSDCNYKMNIDTLFCQTRSLPVMARIVQELIASFDDENVSADYIVSRLARDPVLCAKLLRVANSPYYKLDRQVDTLFDAMSVLGLVNVRTLLISIALTDSFRNTAGIDLKLFWRYSLHTAAVSRYLAHFVGLNPDTAFVAGLMHAVGYLVMHLAMPQTMIKIDQTVPLMEVGRTAFERETLGYCYAEVGGELARRWNFPVPFYTAIAASASPLVGGNSLAAVLHLSAWCVRAWDRDADELFESWPIEAGELVGLSGSQVLRAWSECEPDGMQELVG